MPVKPDPTPHIKVVAATLGATLSEVIFGFLEWVGVSKPPTKFELGATALLTFAAGWLAPQPRPVLGTPPTPWDPPDHPNP